MNKEKENQEDKKNENIENPITDINKFVVDEANK